MDWVQIYAACWWLAGIAVFIFSEDKTVFMTSKIRGISLLLSIPIYGRVFGWL